MAIHHGSYTKPFLLPFKNSNKFGFLRGNKKPATKVAGFALVVTAGGFEPPTLRAEI